MEKRDFQGIAELITIGILIAINIIIHYFELLNEHNAQTFGLGVGVFLIGIGCLRLYRLWRKDVNIG